MSIIISLLTAIVCGQLWRMGGDGEKWARGVGVPVVMSFVKFGLEGQGFLLCLLYGVALWGMMSLFSYGITAPPHKFVVWLFGGKGADGNCRPVEITTRAICGFFWSLAAVSLALLTGNWLAFVLYVINTTVVNAVVGGTVGDVEISERLVGAAVSLAVII